MIFVLRFPVKLLGDQLLRNIRRWKFFYRPHARAVEGVVNEGKSVSWGGAQTKADMHKCILTKICSCKVICCSCV